MNDAVFLGVHEEEVASVAPVSVFRPSPAHGRSLVKWGGLAAFGAAIFIAGLASGLATGIVLKSGTIAVLAICVVLPILFYRNTKLFVTEDHFGLTNLFGAMRLVPRELLVSVEADSEFRFQSADGVTLLSVRPNVWKASQIRQLCSRLGVPFEVSVSR